MSYNLSFQKGFVVPEIFTNDDADFAPVNLKHFPGVGWFK
jgi:hypothetical protein